MVKEVIETACSNTLCRQTVEESMGQQWFEQGEKANKKNKK